MLPAQRTGERYCARPGQKTTLDPSGREVAGCLPTLTLKRAPFRQRATVRQYSSAGGRARHDCHRIAVKLPHARTLPAVTCERLRR